MLLEERPSCNRERDENFADANVLLKNSDFYLCKNGNDALRPCIWDNSKQNSETEWPGKVPLTFLFLMTYQHSGRSNLSTTFSKIMENKNNSSHILFRDNNSFSSLLYVMWDQGQNFVRVFGQRHYLIRSFLKCLKIRIFCDFAPCYKCWCFWHHSL